jgi:hypothetical protein
MFRTRFAVHYSIAILLLFSLIVLTVRLNKAKCEFNKSQLKFLGHTLSKEGVKPDTAKLKTVNNFRFPKNPIEVKSFLGLVNFRAKYIGDFATLAEPLRQHCFYSWVCPEVFVVQFADEFRVQSKYRTSNVCTYTGLYDTRMW